MKTYQANLLNSLTLILMSLWAYFSFEPSAEKLTAPITAFIPLAFGVILIICNPGIKKENKTISHVAVAVTFLAIIGLTKPLNAAIDEDRLISVFRVSLMILTGVIAMIVFIKSFIENRTKSIN